MTQQVIKILTSDITANSSSRFINRKKKVIPSECKICGSVAHYSYYGATSCHSCKMFFRRNAEIGQLAFKCHYDGQCQVTINNRHICTSCRLSKCFRSGMRTDMFRSSCFKKINRKPQPKNLTTTEISTDLVKIIEQHQIPMLPTLSLLRSDKSSLSSIQWTLLSNLVNSYDEHKILLVTKRLMEKNEFFQFMKPANEIMVKDFFKLLYETTELCLRSNVDICNLSSNDRSVVLRTGADSITCFGGAFILSLSQILTCPSFMDVLNSMYGKFAVSLTIHSMKFIDPDITLAKMALLLLVFSENTCVFSQKVSLDHTHISAILQIQNTYAELVWKYLLYRYGHHQAVLRFLNLIQCLLAVIQTMYYLQRVQTHVDNIELLAEQTELTLILDDIDHINEDNN